MVKSACMLRKLSEKRSPVLPKAFGTVFSTKSLVSSGDFFILYSTYIIYSEKLNRFYCGHTSDITERLVHHNSGISEFTSKASDWILMWEEKFETRELARKREISENKLTSFNNSKDPLSIQISLVAGCFNSAIASCNEEKKSFHFFGYRI
jgi:putative endonuclease